MIKSALNNTEVGLLCNQKISVYRSRMDKDNLEKFRLRVKEAIEDSPPTQTAIANYCDVTVQSVGGWKRTGQISKDNLKKLSEISGYRYLYLLNGEGPKTFDSSDENRKEMQVSETSVEYSLYQDSPNTERLLKALRFAIANQKLSDESIGILADFLNSLVATSSKRDS